MHAPHDPQQPWQGQQPWHGQPQHGHPPHGQQPHGHPPHSQQQHGHPPHGQQQHGHPPHGHPQHWHGQPQHAWHGHPQPQWHAQHQPQWQAQQGPHPQWPQPQPQPQPHPQPRLADSGHQRLVRFAVLFGFAVIGMPAGCVAGKAVVPDGTMTSLGFGLAFMMLPLSVVLGAKAWWFLADMRDMIRTYSNARSGPRAGSWAFVPISALVCGAAGLVLGFTAASASAISTAAKLGLLGCAFGCLLWVLARAGVIPSEEEGA